jgi:hypothetical protein
MVHINVASSTAIASRLAPTGLGGDRWIFDSRTRVKFEFGSGRPALPMKRLPQQCQPLRHWCQALAASGQDANVVGVALSHGLHALQTLVDVYRRLGLFLGRTGDQVVEVVDDGNVFYNGMQ